MPPSASPAAPGASARFICSRPGVELVIEEYASPGIFRADRSRRVLAPEAVAGAGLGSCCVSRAAHPSRRAFVVVIDACGAGALPDAAAYGDEGVNTLSHLAQRNGGLDLPMLGSLGLGSILPLDGVAPASSPVLHGRLHPLGPGKDSTTGHWELMGVVDAFTAAHIPRRVSVRGDRRGHEGQRPTHCLQPALQRDRRDRGLRRRARFKRRADRLHEPGLGPPDRCVTSRSSSRTSSTGSARRCATVCPPSTPSAA